MSSPNSAPLVFIVDNERVASTLTVILKLHGFSATYFSSPLEALTAARVKATPGISATDLAS
jgi:DNA phosphorothioation-dependent restriction protein DptG